MERICQVKFEDIQQPKKSCQGCKNHQNILKPQLLWSFGFIHHYFLPSSTSPFHDRPIVFSSRFSLHQFPAVSSMETKLAKHPQAGAQFGFATLPVVVPPPFFVAVLARPLVVGRARRDHGMEGGAQRRMLKRELSCCILVANDMVGIKSTFRIRIWDV